ncbi:hypothetical protein ACHAW5_007205 [Stephanodiscus triporus]|uniref:SCP domain-containing protein n=1 Tax=Stephanodiscus triporus TaxID=2934178 RepID=A0ABD3MDT9_9STRA
MTDRDRQYLNSHNTRRKVWHERYNKAYVPLKWDDSLKAEAKVWAETLLASCGKGMYHDPNTVWRVCDRKSGHRQLWAPHHRPNQENWQPPQQPSYAGLVEIHQVCGVRKSSKDMGEGKTCHTQVCRYARPVTNVHVVRHPVLGSIYLSLGNCNMNKYKERTTRLVDRADDVGGGADCADQCPPNGCH